MKRDELCGELREEYQVGRGSGVLKTGNPGFNHIWFVVPPSPPEVMPPRLPIKSLTRAHQTLEKLPAADELSKLDLLVARLLLRHEAVSSSRMEGTWSTVDHVLTPGEELDDSTDLEASHSSVRGYANALEESFLRINREGIEAFDIDLVSELHKKIMEKDPRFQGRAGWVRSPDQPGEIVFIGGSGRVEDSIYNPTPPEKTKDSLAKVMAWYRDAALVEMGDAGMGMTFPIRIAIGHSHFEAVHPFSDGNGRVGRMLWPLQMLAANKNPLYLSGYVEANKDEYCKALAKAQKKLNYSSMIEFICEAIVSSFREEVKTKSTLQALPDLWKKRGKIRKNSAAEKALNILFKSPILTANELSAQLGLSFQAASTALNKLESDGIVKERTGFGRNRIFAAEEVISVLGREFGQDPKVSLEYARNKSRLSEKP